MKINIILILLGVISLSIMTSCSTPVVVKECDQTISGKYYVCKTLGL